MKTGLTDSGYRRLAKIVQKTAQGGDETTWYGPGGEPWEPSSIQKQVFNALTEAARRISEADYKSQYKNKKPPKQVIPSAESETLLDAAQAVMSGEMDPEEAMNLLRVPEIERKRFLQSAIEDDYYESERLLDEADAEADRNTTYHFEVGEADSPASSRESFDDFDDAMDAAWAMAREQADYEGVDQDELDSWGDDENSGWGVCPEGDEGGTWPQIYKVKDRPR